jgi:hypothetical protein
LLSIGTLSQLFRVSPVGFVDRRAWGMAFRIKHDCESRELIAEYPLAPISDDRAYSRAIAILDRLFDLGDRRTPAEMEFFHKLAILACEYEQAATQNGVKTL